MSLREFTDEQGREWKAWDTVPRVANLVRKDLSAGWVSFECECDEEKRRFSPVPEKWDTLPQERLQEMLRAAVPITVRIDRDDPGA